MEIDEYERALQLISLCYLLHRRDLLPQVAKLFDPSSDGEDTLYEDLLAFGLEGRVNVDVWFHDNPYRDLVNSLYRDTDNESISDITSYLGKWYSGLAKAPWHNSHLQIESDSCAGYFGYWAIEAAAVAFLLDLDDSTFKNHLVYPKHLVEYARKLANTEMSVNSVQADTINLRVPSGSKCPQSGVWETLVKPNSRQYFVAGQDMPEVEKRQDGKTVWHWSSNQ